MTVPPAIPPAQISGTTSPVEAIACARCAHSHDEHDRRDGVCARGGVFRDTPWQCECPRFVWPEDVFTVEVSA